MDDQAAQPKRQKKQRSTPDSGSKMTQPKKMAKRSKKKVESNIDCSNHYSVVDPMETAEQRKTRADWFPVYLLGYGHIHLTEGNIADVETFLVQLELRVPSLADQIVQYRDLCIPGVEYNPLTVDSEFKTMLATCKGGVKVRYFNEVTVFFTLFSHTDLFRLPYIRATLILNCHQVLALINRLETRKICMAKKKSELKIRLAIHSLL